MKNISKLLSNGFESSIKDTYVFLKFYDSFVKSFKRKFNSIGATDYCFNIGHFYIIGFFKVGEQIYYFSLSDVRDMWRGQKNVLFRTAKSYEDYTGGTNTFINLDSSEGIIKEFLRKFGLSKDLIKTSVSKKDDSVCNRVDFLIKNNGGVFNIPSSKQAKEIMFLLMDKLNVNCERVVNVWKRGRKITGVIHRNDIFWTSYDAETKKMSVDFQ